MKLSGETLTILQNFAKINNGLKFKQGHNLSTISSSQTVLAKATVTEQFPEDFCVYDLNQFLVVYNLNKDTEIDFDNANIIFKSGRSKTKYRKTDETMIVTAPEKTLSLPSIDASFTLSDEDYAAILKSASVLQSPHIAVESDGDKIVLTAFDMSNDSAHTQSIEVGQGNGNVFKAIFLTENFKMIPGSYDVQISSKGLSLFKNKKGFIEYWVALESKSKFNV